MALGEAVRGPPLDGGQLVGFARVLASRWICCHIDGERVGAGSRPAFAGVNAASIHSGFYRGNSKSYAAAAPVEPAR